VTLRQKIEREIGECGPIPFSRYMERCLFDPEYGYYSCHAGQFGKAGDFYTSSDVHAVFGRLLARQFEEMWRVLGSPGEMEILELGPGRGLFAQDVLDWSEKKFPEFFRAVHYSLAESSPALRELLPETLRRHFAAGKASLAGPGAGPAIERSKADSIERTLGPEVPLVVFANEFFDALPVEVISIQGELRISAENGRFLETWVPASDEELNFLDCYGVHPEPGERTEAPLLAQGHMARIAATVPRGFVIAIDYGYTRAEQLAGRHRGTVMAFRQHSSSTNPYEAPGEQDITAHVNLTALSAAAEQNRMAVHRPLTQSQFLLGIGQTNQFADAFEPCQLPAERAKVALQLKHLATPAGMGETFQVLVASKGVGAEEVANLSGLSFSRGPR
jgi:SAM-dependent MidA family methyltransferase